nr:phage tail tape measure protein [uncultured Cellulosilyticum sp.]
MAKVIDAVLKLTDQFTPVLKNAQKAISQTSKQAMRAGKEIQKVGKNIEKVGKGLSVSVTAPLAAIGAASIKTTMDFDASMSKVKALSQSTAEDLKLLRDSAIEWGGKTAWSAAEVSEAFQYMSLAGWDTKEMLDGIGGALNTASATGEDLKMVTDIITDGLSAFGLTAKDATMFGDVLTATALNSNTTIEMLGEAFKYAAPLAGSFGFSVQDTALAMGLMANSSVKASNAGTAMRKIFTALTGDLEILQKDGTKYIVETADPLTGQMRSLDAILRDVRIAFNGMSEAQATAMNQELIDTAQTLGIALENQNGQAKTSAELYSELAEEIEGLTAQGKIAEAESIAGKTAMAGLLTIINASQKDYDKLSNAIASCYDEQTGFSLSAKVAKEMLENLAGQVKIITSGLTTLAIQIGDIFTPTLTKVANKVQEVVNYFTALDEAKKKQIVKWSLVAASIGPALLVFGNVIKFIGKAVVTFGKFGKAVKGINTIKGALGLIFTPANTVVLVITAIALAAFLIIKYWKPIKAFFSGVFDKIKSILLNAGLDIENLKTMFVKLKTSFTGAIKNVLTVLSALWQAIGPILIGLGIAVTVAFSAVGGAIIGLLGGVFKHFGEFINRIIDLFGGIILFITSVFAGEWGNAWDGVVSIFKGIFGGLLEIARSIINGVIGVINGGIKGVHTVASFFGATKGEAPQIPMLYKGTNNWQGGPAMIHDKGAEIVDLPQGSRVIPHDKSLMAAKAEGMKQSSATQSSGIVINVSNLNVREESDIDKIANALYSKFKKQALNMA